MILVPYFCKTTPNWTTLGLLLCSGGREMWSINDKDKAIIKMLNENGIPVLDLKKEDDVIYTKIDHSNLNLSEFYIWDEIDHLTFNEDVWRTYNIPNALWSCPIFKESFWKSSGLPAFFSKSALMDALVPTAALVPSAAL